MRAREIYISWYLQSVVIKRFPHHLRFVGAITIQLDMFASKSSLEHDAHILQRHRLQELDGHGVRSARGGIPTRIGVAIQQMLLPKLLRVVVQH
jgi:hypothetical protein